MTLQQNHKNAPHGSPITYINPSAPAACLPAYSGISTERLVPDTLDLARMAALVIHGMTGPTDAEADCEVYWRAHFWNKPAMMIHAPSDSGVKLKFLFALPLARLMSGSKEGEEVERCWLRSLWRERGPHGLICTALQGRPWGRFSAAEAAAGFEADQGTAEHVVEPQKNGYALAAACCYAELGDRERWEELARGIVDDYKRLIVRRGNEAYLARTWFAWDQIADSQAPPPKGITASFAAWSALGLNLCWRHLGYEPARDLAAALLRYIVRSGGYFAADGRFLPDMAEVGPDHPRYGITHFHGHAIVALHALHHAILTGDQELLEFSHRVYEVARGYGDPVLGWFPEMTTGNPKPHTAELCCVADMLMMAVMFAAAGLDDGCWDDADRWVRNQFAEGQLRRTDWIERLSTGMNPTLATGRWQYACFDNVAERNLGAFAGWADVNDWVHFHEERRHMRGIMHCCTGNAARALYVAWYHALSHQAGKLRVNLLLNRASPWAEVHSHLPYAGQVDVIVREPLDLSVRIPEWVRPAEVSATVDHRPRALRFDGRYAQLGGVKPGESASLRFPIQERESAHYIEGRRFVVRRKGNDVVLLDPPGRYCPLYQRDHYRENETRWVRRAAFVAERVIPW